MNSLQQQLDWIYSLFNQKTRTWCNGKCTEKELNVLTITPELQAQVNKILGEAIEKCKD